MQLSLSTKEILICTAVSAAWVGISLMTGVPNFTILHIALTASFAAAQVFFSYAFAKASWPYVQQTWNLVKQRLSSFKGKSNTATKSAELKASSELEVTAQAVVEAQVAPQPKFGILKRAWQSVVDFAQHPVENTIHGFRAAWAQVVSFVTPLVNRARAAFTKKQQPSVVVEVAPPTSREATPDTTTPSCCSEEAKAKVAAEEVKANAEEEAKAQAEAKAKAAEEETKARSEEEVKAKAAEEAKAEEEAKTQAAAEAKAKAAEEEAKAQAAAEDAKAKATEVDTTASTVTVTPVVEMTAVKERRSRRRVDQLKEGNASDYSSGSDNEGGSRRRSQRAPGSPAARLSELLTPQAASVLDAPASPKPAPAVYAPASSAAAAAQAQRQQTPPAQISRTHSHYGAASLRHPK